MVKTYLSMLLAIVAFALNVNAQVTSKPSPLQVDSKDVTIFFHADQGSKGLMGQLSKCQNLCPHRSVA